MTIDILEKKSSDRTELINLLYQEISNDPISYNFDQDTQMIKRYSRFADIEAMNGESIFSSRLKHKILGQKDFFFNMSEDLKVEFPLLEVSDIFYFLSIVRKFTLFFVRPDEHNKIPLVSVPFLEYLAFSSEDPNAKFIPFFNFMNEKVFVVSIARFFV